MSHAFEVVPTGTVGAEVKGVDLAAITEAGITAIKSGSLHKSSPGPPVA